MRGMPPAAHAHALAATALRGDPHTKTWNLYTSDDGKAPVHEAMRNYYVFALEHWSASSAR